MAPILSRFGASGKTGAVQNDVWWDLPDPALAINEAMPKHASQFFPYSTDAVSAVLARATQFLGIEVILTGHCCAIPCRAVVHAALGPADQPAAPTFCSAGSMPCGGLYGQDPLISVWWRDSRLKNER